MRSGDAGFHGIKSEVGPKHTLWGTNRSMSKPREAPLQIRESSMSSPKKRNMGLEELNNKESKGDCSYSDGIGIAGPLGKWGQSHVRSLDRDFSVGHGSEASKASLNSIQVYKTSKALFLSRSRPKNAPLAYEGGAGLSDRKRQRRQGKPSRPSSCQDRRLDEFLLRSSRWTTLKRFSAYKYEILRLCRAT